jgi:hypothetical protein
MTTTMTTMARTWVAGVWDNGFRPATAHSTQELAVRAAYRLARRLGKTAGGIRSHEGDLRLYSYEVPFDEYEYQIECDDGSVYGPYSSITVAAKAAKEIFGWERIAFSLPYIPFDSRGFEFRAWNVYKYGGLGDDLATIRRLEAY